MKKTLSILGGITLFVTVGLMAMAAHQRYFNWYFSVPAPADSWEDTWNWDELKPLTPPRVRGPAEFGTFIHCFHFHKNLDFGIWIALPDMKAVTCEELLPFCPLRISINGIEYERFNVPEEQNNWNPRNIVVNYLPIAGRTQPCSPP